MTDRNDYVRDVLVESFNAVTGVLSGGRLSGSLISLTLERNGSEDWIHLRFTQESPERDRVEYSYRHPVFTDGVEPQMSAHSVGSVIFGALIERIRTWPHSPVDGVVALN